MRTPQAYITVLVALFTLLTCDVVVVSQTQAPAPQEIIKKMAERYAALSSYQDSGVVQTVTEGPLARRGTDIGFKTHFTRPNKLRFEWLDYSSVSTAEKNAVWSDGTKSFSYYSWTPDVVEMKENLSLALAGATGISRGSAHTVPQLLMEEIGGFSLTELTTLTLKKREVFEGEDCYVIEGFHPNGKAWQLWISTRDLLLRKFRSPSLEDEFTEEIHREIKVGDKIAEETYQPKVEKGRIANVITKEKEADIRKLLALVQPRERINNELNELTKLLKAAWPQVTEKVWQEVFTEVRFDADVVLQIYVSTYDWHYSGDEIKQLLNFYESPVGQKLGRSDYLVQFEATRRGFAIGIEMSKRIQEKLKAKGYKSAA
jgi:outer membrane lipoprotein-sorting protein